MEYIRDADGHIIKRSNNLRGIREYVGHNIIRVLSIDRIGQWEGKLCILFENGASYETNFACFDVLKGFVQRWRNVAGCPLLVEGQPAEWHDFKKN
jgi:hypothetical protein